MNNRNYNFTFLNISVILFHLANLGIVIGEPFQVITNVLVSLFIAIFLVLFSVLIEENTGSKTSGMIYHLVSMWTFIITYFYLSEHILLSYFDDYLLWALFFLLLSILSIITTIRLKENRIIHLSYISFVLTFFSLLQSFKLDENLIYLLIGVVVSIFEMIIYYIKKDKHNIISLASLIVLIFIILSLSRTKILYVSLLFLIIAICSVCKIWLFKEKREKEYLPFKIIAFVFAFSSFLSNIYFDVIAGTFVSLLVYGIALKKGHLSNKVLYLLYGFLLIMSFSYLVFDLDYVIYLFFSLICFIGYFINKDYKFNYYLSLCFGLIFVYLYLNSLLTGDEIRSILNLIIIIVISFILKDYLFKSDKNKDAFLTICNLGCIASILEKNSLLLDIFIILISVIMIDYAMSHKEYKATSILGKVLLVVGFLKIINLYYVIPTSIYVLILAMILSFYFLSNLNNKKLYCENCGQKIKSGSKYCENCGKKL